MEAKLGAEVKDSICRISIYRLVGERFMRSEGQMRVWLERMEVKMLA